MVISSLLSSIFNKLSIGKPDNYRIFNAKFYEENASCSDKDTANHMDSIHSITECPNIEDS
jgi:hypothetical protein